MYFIDRQRTACRFEGGLDGLELSGLAFGGHDMSLYRKQWIASLEAILMTFYCH